MGLPLPLHILLTVTGTPSWRTALCQGELPHQGGHVYPPEKVSNWLAWAHSELVFLPPSRLCGNSYPGVPWGLRLKLDVTWAHTTLLVCSLCPILLPLHPSVWEPPRSTSCIWIPISGSAFRGLNLRQLLIYADLSFLKNDYLFGCVRSQLQQVGSLRCHVRSFIAAGA